MRARACVKTRLEPADHRGRTRSRLATLRSEPPLILRPIVGNGAEPWVQGDRDAVRIALTAGAAGPIGGDQLDLTVHVGDGSTLVLSEISHTLLLPSHDNATSATTFHVTVEAGATLIWLPEPIIAAHRCDHINTVDITLAEGARLMVREELLLGRHLEPSGRLRQRTSGNRGPAATVPPGSPAGRPEQPHPSRGRQLPSGRVDPGCRPGLDNRDPTRAPATDRLGSPDAAGPKRRPHQRGRRRQP